MRENREIVPVFFTTDEKYAPYLSVALTSLIANTDPTSDTSYRVIVVHKDLSQQAQEIFRAMSTDKVAVELYPMRDYMIQSINSDHNKLRADYETLTIYFRLFLSEMFPGLDKAIYLDADTVTNVDIAQLYRIDLGDNFVAAVNDNFVAAGEETSYYTLNALGIPSSEYVNSGVLLMNLKAMREAGFVDHFVKLLNAYHVESIAADQDYLNVMCRGRILMLGYEWNTMRPMGRPGPSIPRSSTTTSSASLGITGMPPTPTISGGMPRGPLITPSWSRGWRISLRPTPIPMRVRRPSSSPALYGCRRMRSPSASWRKKG